MSAMKALTAPVKRLTTAGEHWFFGYYDIPAFDSACENHLALRVPFMDRMPTADDKAEIYRIRLKTGSADKIGETASWCFQQGCFAQWLPARPGWVIWNERARTECGYAAVMTELASGKKREYDRPIANVAPNGKYALSVNFDRMYDFRPGYGYAGHADRWATDPHPADDGIYLIDLDSGESRLILSLRQLWELNGGFFGGEDQKLMVNHINFNTDSSRFVFLLRNFSTSGWKTAILTANADGSGIFLLSAFAYASHYYWVDASILSIHSSGLELGRTGKQLYELIDKTHAGKAVDPAFFIEDGHVSYSPDRKYILYDSYPKPNGYRELYLYDRLARRGGLLGRFQSWKPPIADMRCDLHPVWAPNGQMISFDSTHEGFRGIYLMDVTEAMRELADRR